MQLDPEVNHCNSERLILSPIAAANSSCREDLPSDLHRFDLNFVYGEADQSSMTESSRSVFNSNLERSSLLRVNLK